MKIKCHRMEVKSKVKNISEDDIVDDIHTVMEKGMIAKDIL